MTTDALAAQHTRFGRETAVLALLSLAYFVVGVTSLAVVGVLGSIGAALAVSPGAAAGLVTAFALSFAVAAPLAQAWLTRWPLPALLTAGLVLLAAGAAATGLATSYEGALAARIASGAAAALVGPSALAIGAALVPAERRGRALGTIFGGMTLATVLGVPLAAWLGAHLSWRTVFLLVAGLGLITAVAARAWVPASVGAGRTRLSLGDVAVLLARRGVGFGILASLLQMLAQFITYALVAVLLAERFGSGADQVSVALLVFGAAGVVGNAVGGRLSDAIRPETVVRLSFAGLALSFLAVMAVPSYPLALVAFAGWAATSLLLMTPQQKRLVTLAGDRTAVALGLNSAAIYIGMAAGSSLGGAAHAVLGVQGLPALSLAVVLVAAASAEWAMRAPQAR